MRARRTSRVPARPALGAGIARIWARVEAAGARAEAERAAEWKAAVPALADLLALPASERGATAASARYRTLAVVDGLLQTADGASAHEAEQLAGLALSIVEELDAARYGARTLSGRGGVGRCLWADARRRQGDLAGAELGFRQAAQRLAEEPLDTWERAIYCRRLAALRCDEEREDEALGLLERSVGLFTLWGKTKLAGEALCDAADLWLRSDDPESALALLLVAQDAVEPPQFPELAIRIRHGLALCHAQLCEPEECVKTLKRAQALYPLVPALVQRLRYLATEARIAEESDRENRAVSLLRPLVGRFLEERADFEAAQAALDLARLHVSRGNFGELRRLSQEVAPLLAPDRLPEPAASVLRFALQFASRDGRDPDELLTQAGDYLRRAEENPRLPWRWGSESWPEVPWNEVEADLRVRFCEEAGLPQAHSGLSAAELSPQDRRLLSWTQQALHRVRIVFGAEEDE